MITTAHVFWDAPFRWGLALAGLSLVVQLIVRNRLIRRRQRLTFFTLIVLAGLHLALVFVPATRGFDKGPLLEALLLALALINAVVTVVFNPWFSDRVRDRAPTIVQDTVVIGTFLIVGVFFFQEDAHVFATSAVAGVILGFALQETLGTAFAGIAIQIDRPFRVGHWIAVSNYQGRVVEVTWRATKIRTKDGNLIVLPNSLIARESIQNFSEPQSATRQYVDIGATYLAAPNDVKAALLAAMGRVPDVLADPAPAVGIVDFGESAISYRALFWINDFARAQAARSDVRIAIYYEFSRRGIEIPWPIRVLYQRQEKAGDADADSVLRAIAAVPVLAPLPADAQRALAAAARDRLFGDGEVIVREGDRGSSMFLVRRGHVVVAVGSERRQVATIESGGYFGEMSLLTGESRTATVIARGDCSVLEISADAFRAYLQQNPDVIDHLAAAADTRRRELETTRAAASVETGHRASSLARKIRDFFGLA